MMISQKIAEASSGERRSMNEPRFHSAMPPTKYAKTRFSRLAGFRSRQTAASETFSRQATSGRRLCGLTGGEPSAAGVAHFVPATNLFDLVLQDPEDDDVPEASVVEPGLAEHALLVEPVP